MLDVSSTAALSSQHAPIPTTNDPLTSLVNIRSLRRTGCISVLEQFLQKTLKLPSKGKLISTHECLGNASKCAATYVPSLLLFLIVFNCRSDLQQ